jgi:hypothetical protein
MSKYAGSEVLTAVVMKSSIFWDITPCSPLKVTGRFGGARRLDGRRISQARNQREAGSKQATTRRYIPEHGTLHEQIISLFNVASVLVIISHIIL